MQQIPLASQIELANLLQSTTCPNCWHKFLSEEVRFVATHPDMELEPQFLESSAGEKERRRFIPERFSAEGIAIDPRGALSKEVACPRCKLTIPRMSLELPPVIISVLGEKGSGKSIFMASMVFAMRQRQGRIAIRFSDADNALNHTLIRNEQKLFMDHGSSSYRNFDDVVKATEINSDASWRESKIEGVCYQFLPPFTFKLGPRANHPSSGNLKNLEKILCLYDNAGEHFAYESRDKYRFMTGHLARSSGLIFTFDPTQDMRFRKVLKSKKSKNAPVGRQDVFLTEAEIRIREEMANTLSPRDQIPKPIVVALTKYDVWEHLIKSEVPKSLFETVTGAGFECIVSEDVRKLSNLCRQLLIDQGCREIVDTAEAMSADVTFCPVAAVGRDIRMRDGQLMFRIDNEGPIWSEIPLLCLLNKSNKALFPSCKRTHKTALGNGDT